MAGNIHILETEQLMETTQQSKLRRTHSLTIDRRKIFITYSISDSGLKSRIYKELIETKYPGNKTTNQQRGFKLNRVWGKNTQMANNYEV
jgi:hypothetical protein